MSFFQEETKRLDIIHNFFLVARNNALFSVPLSLNRPLRVLDLGTGTGVWAIHLAERYKSAAAKSFQHADTLTMYQFQLAASGSSGRSSSDTASHVCCSYQKRCCFGSSLTCTRIPPNMTTVQLDIEDVSWDPLMKNCDLVHLRMLYGSIENSRWPGIYRRAFE